MRNIAIIPARSGSKGLKDKNIKLLEGKPLIAYTIEAALGSGVFEEIMVSTNSGNYADIARKYGANVPFLRSEQNAQDTSSTWDVVDEILNEYDKLGKSFDTFCLLQPTSPLRTSADIVNAYHEYLIKNAIAVVSVCECEHSPRWSNTLDDSLSLDGFVTKNNSGQRQMLESYYRLNGAVYIMNTSQFKKDRFLYRHGAYAYVMEKEKSIDIDNEFDFRIAEILMKEKNQPDRNQHTI